MKKIAYLDCASGISGDMCLGALLDAGVPLNYLQTQLASLGLADEFTLTAKSVVRRGLRALKAEVTVSSSPSPDPDRHGHCHSHGHRDQPEQAHQHAHSPGHPQDDGHNHGGDSFHDHSHPEDQAPTGVTATVAPQITPSHAVRNLPTIEALITVAPLPARAIQWSLAIFRRLAAAEAAVHGIPIEQVHFHEVGATDAIVDVVGTCLGLDWLQVDALFCSPLPTGSGRVKAAHGWLPVPAPAVLKLLELGQVPIYSNGIAAELVTPTGAAIVTTLANQFGDPPAMALQRTGLGAGTKDFPIANILRLWLGTTTAAVSPVGKRDCGQPEHPVAPKQAPANLADPALETVVVLETQVDDMLPQAVGYLYERLLAAGALDVFTQAIGMKKSRPGVLITVICHPETVADCEFLLFQETPTLGIRRQQQQRRVLDRCFQHLNTPYGEVAMKLAYHPQTGQLMNAHPEYEDCVALARTHGVPWQTVYHSALSSWYTETTSQFTRATSPGL